MARDHKFAAEPEKHPWSIPILPDFYVEGTIFGRYISDNMPAKRVGIIYENDEYGTDELAGLGITITLSPTDHLAVEAMKMLRATVVDGKGKWEYFGELISFRD